jgi:hypothetical protein
VRGCPIDYFTVPVTFKNEKGYVKLTGYEGSYSMNVSLEFRWEDCYARKDYIYRYKTTYPGIKLHTQV